MKIYKTFILSISVLLLIGNKSNAQQYREIYPGDSIPEKHRILYILKEPNKSPAISEDLIISANAIEKISDVHNINDTSAFKLLHTSTIWIIQPKKGITFLTFDEILSRFKLESYKSSPVRIDNWIVRYPNAIIAQTDEIAKVDIVMDDKGLNYINIISHHPIEHKKISNSGYFLR